MTRDGAQTAIMTSALVVAGTYAIRKLIEPAASAVRHPATTLGASVLQVAGADPAPAAVGQWATGFGFVYISLAIANTFAPSLAGSMAVLVATSNTIINGGAIFTDISGQVGAKPAAVREPSPLTGTLPAARSERIGRVGVTQSGQEHQA